MNNILQKTKLSQSCDKDGVVLPWLNAPSLVLIQKMVDRSWEVFEWGAGAGSYWWALHTKNIISVEHKKAWVNQLQRLIQQKSIFNLSINYAPLTKTDRVSYPAFITKIKNMYDVIIIDGRERVACARYAKVHVKPGGWIILDNSNRLRYKSVDNILAGWQKTAFKTRAGWGTTLYCNIRGKDVIEVASMNRHKRLQEEGALKVSQEGGITPAKGWILDSLLRQLLPQTVLEIGFNQGRSAMLVLEALPKTCQLTSIDVGKHECVLHNSIQMEKIYRNLHMVFGDSKQVLPNILRDMPALDFALVDGGHDYATCVADITACLNHLSDRGVIWVDDYNKYNSISYKAPGVELACDELKKKYAWRLFKEEGVMLFTKDVRGFHAIG